MAETSGGKCLLRGDATEAGPKEQRHEGSLSTQWERHLQGPWSRKEVDQFQRLNKGKKGKW